MRMRQHVMWASAALLAVLCLVTGCEDVDTAEGLALSPSSALLTAPGDTVNFVVNTTNRTIFFPLEWTVTNPDLGTIHTTSGGSAVYESFGYVGNNIVTVSDQSGAEGVATVQQR